jgi:hypothetical protein
LTRKIGEWSQDHPAPKVETCKAKPRERAAVTFATDKAGKLRKVAPDHANRAQRRAWARA